LPKLACTLHTVTKDDPLATFRVELKRRREYLGLTTGEAADRAEISRPRWVSIEAGYEVKQGNRITANPRRSTLIKMARAVEWSPAAALKLAGMAAPTVTEEVRGAGGVREELLQVIADLSEARVRALLHVARTMLDPGAVITDPVEPKPTGPDPSSVWHQEHILGTPDEPVRSVDGYEGDDYDPGLIQGS
jgi:hypothetical protein